jgi:hypothetical protein
LQRQCEIVEGRTSEAATVAVIDTDQRLWTVEMEAVPGP